MRSIDVASCTWRRSSYSNGDGGECVEVSDDFLISASWRKNSYSNGDGGACLEVSDDFTAVVPVRDSKTAEGPALIFGVTAWAAFTESRNV